MEPHEIGNKGEDMREESSRAYNGCPFASIGMTSFNIMMKREQFISGLWDCGSNLYKLSMCFTN
jgi:hypothetical protein